MAPKMIAAVLRRRALERIRLTIIAKPSVLLHDQSASA
jgi:hypothetical protein